jgi:hypothetical protein
MARIQLDNEEFWLADEIAMQVRMLAVTDQAAARALASRSAQRHAITVPMHMMDAAPPAARSAPSQPTRTPTPMTTSPMKKIQIGDREAYVDATIASEIEYLRGTVDFFRAMNEGHVQPVNDTSHLSLAEMGRRRKQPGTSYGDHCERIRNAWKNPA